MIVYVVTKKYYNYNIRTHMLDLASEHVICVTSDKSLAERNIDPKDPKRYTLTEHILAGGD